MPMERPPKEKIIVDKSNLKEWIKWAVKGDWGVKGYRIIEGVKGRKLGELEPQRYIIVERPHAVVYQHSQGLVSKFFEGLLEKKLYGTKCPKCKIVYCPPRAHCWNPECKLQETEWIELPLSGRVITYTIMAFSATAFLRYLPFILAYVQVDGAHTALPVRLTEIDPIDVYVGLRVKLKFIDEPKGELMDLYAVPAEKPKPPKREPKSIERLKKDLEKVYEWRERKFGIPKPK